MSSLEFVNQKSLFKAYDIRGKRYCFTPNFTHALSDALAYYFVDNSNCNIVVIGYDTRHGSLQIAETLAQSFINLEITVIWLGLVTTPIMAYWANKYQGHGLIATASHSEPDFNGIKWLLNGESPSSEDIQQIYKTTSNFSKIEDCTMHYDSLLRRDSKMPSKHRGSKSSSSSSSFQALDNTLQKKSQITFKTEHFIRLDSSKAAESYYNATADALSSINKALLSSKSERSDRADSKLPNKFKIVIDCLNGATSLFAEEFFKQHCALCSEIIVLNATPDGDFPKGNPDPMEENRLEELCDAVLIHQADLGFSFDGDGDRLMVVDHNGKPLIPDHLLYLLARVAIEDYDAKKSNAEASDQVAVNNLVTTHSSKIVKNSNFTNSKKSETASNHLEADATPDADSIPIVIFDVKCSHHLPVLIQQIGAKGKMSKTGSSIFRRALQSNQYGSKELVLFAGELSGHYIFNDGYFLLHDDAMYAALRLLNWLYYQPINPLTQLRTTIADIVHSLPSMVSTTDVYLPVDRYTLNEFNCMHNDICFDIKNRTLDIKNLPDEPILFKHSDTDSKMNQFIIDKFQTTHGLSNTVNYSAEGCQSDAECIEDTGDIRQTILDQMRKLCQNLLNSSSDSNECDANLQADSISASNINANKKGDDAKTQDSTYSFKLSFIDGLRLDFEHGFGIIRSSRTSNKLTVRFAGDTLSDLLQVQSFFVNLCQYINQDLANQVANIRTNRYT